MSLGKGITKARLLQGVRVLVLLLLLALVLLETIGFPRWATEAVTRRLSQSNYVVHAEGMSLDLISGLYFKDVVVFRKKVIGPPAIKCEGMRVRLINLWGLIGDSGAPSIEFIGGEILPAQAAGEDSDDSGRIAGLHVLLTDISVDQIELERMSAEVTSYGSTVSVTNIVCAVKGQYGAGRASGWLTFEGDHGMSGRIISQLDPHVLLSLLERIGWRYTSRLISRFAWGEEKPLVDTKFSAKGEGDAREFSSESLFSMRDFSYRGVTNDSCEGVVSVNYGSTGGVVSVDNLMIRGREGVVVGGFAYDSRKRTIEYRVASDADPKDFFQVIGLFEREKMASWRFPGTTRFISEGLVDLNRSDGDKTHLLAEVESAGMGAGILQADECRFNVMMNSSTCRFTNIHGSIWDGTFEAYAEIVFTEGTNVMTFGCELSECDFSRAAEASMAQTNALSGTLYLEMDGRMLLSSNAVDTMTAGGRIRVKDGKLFKLPIFGGLTTIMSKIIPGLNFVISQSDLTAEFAVKDGRISSDKISIDGDVLSLSAKGSAAFKGNLDFAIQVKLMSEHGMVAKVLRAVTWPISKLMEFRLKGTPKEPAWYPINFSGELLERIGLKKSSDPKETRNSNTP